MADTARITGSGQVTVPAEIRRELRLQKGDRVRFVRNHEGDIVLRRVMRVSELAGSIPALDRDDVDDDFGNIIREAMEERADKVMARMREVEDHS